MQYNLIPIVSSAAAIPFSIIASLLLDKVGSRFSISFFTTLSISGLSLFAYSTSSEDPNFRNFLVGRALFGMGYVGQIIWFSAVTSQWFYYKEAGIVMASLLAFGFFG